MNRPWPLLRDDDMARTAHPIPLSREWGVRHDDAASTLRRFLTAALAALAVCALAYPMLPRRYEASAAVVLQPTDLDGQADRTLRQPLDENAVQSEVDLIAAPAVADRVIAAHGLRDDPEFNGGGARPRWLQSALPAWLVPPRRPLTDAQLRRELGEHLQAGRDRKSYTIRLGYWSADPEKAAAMTATLLAAYLDAQRARKQASVAWLSGWLGERVRVLSERYEAGRRGIDDFLETSGLIDTGAQVELDHRLQVLSGEAAQARARFIDASTRAESLGAMRAAGTLGDAPEVLASPAVLKLKDGMASALSKTAVWSAETSAFDRQIKVESERIVQAATAEAAGWARREELLSRQIGDARAGIAKRREAERTLAELQRASDSDRLILEDGLSRLKGMTARAKVVEADATVLSDAEAPTKAAFPRPIPMLLASVALALFAGLLAVRRQTVAFAKGLVRE